MSIGRAMQTHTSMMQRTIASIVLGAVAQLITLLAMVVPCALNVTQNNVSLSIGLQTIK